MRGGMYVSRLVGTYNYAYLFSLKGAHAQTEQALMSTISGGGWPLTILPQPPWRSFPILGEPRSCHGINMS